MTEKTRKTSSGKWHTVMSCGSKEELEKMINQYYFSSEYKILEDGTVQNEKTGKIMSLKARNFKGRWQYGQYEIKQETAKTATQKQEMSFDGLREALEAFDETGAVGKSGSWEVHCGAYDLCWELCYEGNSVINAINAHLCENGKDIVYIDNNCLSPKEFKTAYKTIQDVYGKDEFKIHPNTVDYLKAKKEKGFSR